MARDDLRVSRIAFAGVSALTVLAWYALPDIVRSRRVRVVVKAALLGVTAAGSTMLPQVFPEIRHLESVPRLDLSKEATVALAVGATAVGIGGTIWAEKAIYAHGERRRARGVRFAHTPAAAVMALAAGAAGLIDWPRLTGRTTAN